MSKPNAVGPQRFEAIDDLVRRVPYLDGEGRRCTLYVCQAGDAKWATRIADALNMVSEFDTFVTHP